MEHTPLLPRRICGTIFLLSGFWVTGFLASESIQAQIPMPDDAPPSRSPEASAAAFSLPQGFRMEIVASEPLISSPSGVCWDEQGRMFVSELHGYNLEGQLDIEALNKTGKLDTQVRRVQAAQEFKDAAESGTFGVVKLLHDTDHDGRMDRVDVWTKDLPPAYGLVAARGGVIVACAPEIVYVADPNEDGVAEVRETLFSGFRIGALERGINAPQWSPDGWIYFGRGWGGGHITGPNLQEPVDLPDTDFRIRADGSAIEPITGGTHTFGFAMTEAGDRFIISTTNPAIYVAPLPWRYLVRNPDAAASDLEVASGDHRAWSLTAPHPWRQRRAENAEYFEFYRSRYGASDSDAGGWFTSACSPLIYQDFALPGLHGQYLVCEPSGNLIHRAVIEADGAALKIHRGPGEEKSEFAATRDPWSHPMNLAHGPDGSVWIVDYYREIIEDYSAIPRHLQQQYGVYNGHEMGRVYRLTYESAPEALPSDLSGFQTAELTNEIASPYLWRRLTAIRLLVERGAVDAAPALRETLTRSDALPASQLAALHALNQLGELKPEDVIPLFTHPAESVRVQALQVSDRWLADAGSLLEAVLSAAEQEQNPRVLLQLAMSLGETRDPYAFRMLVRFAREHLQIRWMAAALMSSLHARGGAMFAELLNDSEQGQALLLPLAESIAARGDESERAFALGLVITAPEDQRAELQAALSRVHEQPAHDDEIAELVASSAVQPSMQISDEVFREYVDALGGKRDRKRGHEVFTKLCSSCHRIGEEGFDVGPDLLGELGVAEETLVHHLLLPNERIRPGFETTLLQFNDGTFAAGLLKDDGATSVTLLAPGGIKQVYLRKDIAAIQRRPVSLMPSFAAGIAPEDMANLLAWLKSQLHTEPMP